MPTSSSICFSVSFVSLLSTKLRRAAEQTPGLQKACTTAKASFCSALRPSASNARSLVITTPWTYLASASVSIWTRPWRPLMTEITRTEHTCEGNDRSFPPIARDKEGVRRARARLGASRTWPSHRPSASRIAG
eukprot:1143713-Pleurochrysis_carterae.AAC.2